MYRPWREHAAWGMISPNTTMDSVESARPTRPSVKSAIRIATRAVALFISQREGGEWRECENVRRRKGGNKTRYDDAGVRERRVLYWYR
jgi:hypothetical protein